jgi:membrane protease YdiL (CAAX protease family)
MSSEYYHSADWQTRLESLGHSVGIVFAAFLAGLVLALAGRESLAVAGYTRTAYPVVVPAAVTVLQFVGFILVSVAYLQVRDVELFSISFPSIKDGIFVLVGFGALFVASLGLSWVIQQVGAETADNQVITFGQENPEFFLYMIVVTLLLQAPAEELVFRGIVQGLFRNAYGIIPGVIITALMFGAVHFFALQGGGKLIYISVAITLGLILGILYELTDNLVVPSLIHGLWNAFLFASQFAAATMGELPESGFLFL